MMRSFVLAPLLLCAMPALADTLPIAFSVYDALGTPLDGSHDLSLSIYGSATGGTLLWTETLTVSFLNGAALLELGLLSPLTDTELVGDPTVQDRWIELQVDSGAPLPGRIPIDEAGFFPAIPDCSPRYVDTPDSDADGHGTFVPNPNYAVVGAAYTWEAAEYSLQCSPGALPDDCDDADPAVNPSATEVCNGIDDDCDGTADAGVAGTPEYWRDDDQDGFGSTSLGQLCTAPAGSATNGDDCDDTDAMTYPGADELCDAEDRNCDGDPIAGAIDIPTWYRDGDGDGLGDPSASADECGQPSGFVDNPDDCDDTDAAVTDCDSGLEGEDTAGPSDSGGSGGGGPVCASARASGLLGWLTVLPLLGLRRRR